MLGTHIQQLLGSYVTVWSEVFMVSVTASRIIPKLECDCFQILSSLSFISDRVIQDQILVVVTKTINA
jgi:hypothetical protein